MVSLVFAGLFLCAAVVLCFVLIQRGFARQAKRSDQHSEAAEAKLGQITTEIAKLNEKVDAVVEQAALLTRDLSPRRSLTLSKRAQALRQFRHGASAESICNSLDVPKAEVDLLLKIHHLIVRNL